MRAKARGGSAGAGGRLNALAGWGGGVGCAPWCCGSVSQATTFPLDSISMSLHPFRNPARIIGHQLGWKGSLSDPALMGVGDQQTAAWPSRVTEMLEAMWLHRPALCLSVFLDEMGTEEHLPAAKRIHNDDHKTRPPPAPCWGRWDARQERHAERSV